MRAHMKEQAERVKRLSKGVHDTIPPLRFEPVKDAVQRVTLKGFIFWMVIIGLVLFLSDMLTTIFTHPATLEELIINARSFGPLLLVLVIVLEVLITPLPGSITAITAGYFFGTFPGMLYAWIGNAIAVVIAFGLARHFGQPLAKKMVAPRILSFYDGLLRRHPLMLSVLYAVPVFPLVALSLLVGLSALPFKRFLLEAWPALLINMFLLASLGQTIAISGFTNGLVIAGIMLLLACGIALLILTFRRASPPSLPAKAPEKSAPSSQERN